MIRYFIYPLICSIYLCTFSHIVIAKPQGRDPFFAISKEHQQIQRSSNISSISKLKSEEFCPLEGEILAPELNFDQLKIVGVVLGRNEKVVLFVDNKNKLIVAHKNEILAKEGIKIRKIDLNQIVFQKLLFSSGCKKSEDITIQF